MDICTDVALSINPTMDARHNSVVYTFNNNERIIRMNGDIMYKFPYSKGTWWTNFKYCVYPISNQQLIISIILITDEGYSYIISRESFIEQNKWTDTVWPLLSVNMSGNMNINKSHNSGLYFKIKPLKGDEDIQISIKLLGFRNLFPKSENYILISPIKTYQFVFTEFENEDGTTSGTMYNIEHIDYIRDIINKSFIVYLIDDY
jgi:hypothetical protein